MTANTEHTIAIRQSHEGQLLDALIKAQLMDDEQGEDDEGNFPDLISKNFSVEQILAALAYHYRWPAIFMLGFPEAYAAHMERIAARSAQYQLDEIVAGAGR
jgi:hypothetical protein